MGRLPSNAVRNARASALAREDGFSLMEATVAMTLFLILATAISGLLTSGIGAQRVARQRTVAKQEALAEIERIRRLPYDSVGTVSGNPPGSLAASTPLAVTGLNATLTTQVQYVNDPTPTSYTTSANYKKVTVTVTRASDSKQLIRSVTYVAPTARAPYGGINNAIINVDVQDYASPAPIPGAGVALATGPSAPRTDVTDAAGKVSFPALTPNPTSGAQQYYDITAGATGYTTLPDDLPPAAAAHKQLAPGETFDTVIRLYKTGSTILVDVPGWTSCTGCTTTIHVGSSRKAQTFTYSGVQLSIPTLNGEAIVPGLPYTVGVTKVTSTGARSFSPGVTATVPSNYPTVMTSTFSPVLGSTATTKTLTVQVRRGSPAQRVCGARVDISGGPQGIYLTGVSTYNGGSTLPSAGCSNSNTSAGNILFTVPQGTNYTAKAWNAPGTGSNQVTAINVTNNATVTVNVP